jgi:hypothetical protein
MYVDQAGYRLVPSRTPPLQNWHVKVEDIRPAYIIGRGGRKICRRLDDYPALYSTFASVRTPEELLAFVTQYGLLTQRRTGASEGDVVPLVLRQAKWFRTNLNARKANIWNPIPETELKAWLSRDLSVKYGPSTLLDALWLQFAQALSDGAQMRECRHCHRVFPVGGKSGKRLVAEFCSAAHRIEFNSLARSRKS